MRLSISLGLAAAVAACSPHASPRVEDGWVRLPAVAGRPGAGYFTLFGGRDATTLLGVRARDAVRAELHESMTGHAGMASMAPLRQLAVPANGTVAFAPGGRHVMLFDVNPALKPGGTTTLTLSFANGTSIEATARVIGAGDPAP